MAVMMKNETIRELRHLLHEHPELSGHEEQTRTILRDFLRRHTSLEICELGSTFYAAHRENDEPGILLRADYDALPRSDGTAAHLCGHDGHAAVLCGVALALEGKKTGRNVFFLFQPSEETGQGARACLSIFDREKISEVYGQHNLPGMPLGKLYTRPGTFACASEGLTIQLKGKPAHAANPELGISPADTVGKLLISLPELVPYSQDGPIRLCTVVGGRMGEKAFGTSADHAEIWLTLRAEKNAELYSIHEKISSFARGLAEGAGLVYCEQSQDVFPAVINDEALCRKVLSRTAGELLDKPMRWSEDFGYYATKKPSCFFGMGAGIHQPPLHSAEYEYPDDLLEPSITCFLSLLDIQ